MLHKVPVYYTPNIVGARRGSFSPSAWKPRPVVAGWRRRFPVRLIRPRPASVEELCFAHERRYVEGVLDGSISNGFGTTCCTVAASLPYTSGAMIGAAAGAIRNGRVAVAPVSGFHHAGVHRGGAFCTFNGLVVAAGAVRNRGLAPKVGILDCDQHYGDGTDEIIAAIGAGSWIKHVSIGGDRRYRDPRDAERFLLDLPGIVAGFADCQVLIYQAGADPHIADPLGGWLSTAQLSERDRIVFETAQALGLPVAWNLAGGYQVNLNGRIDPILQIHSNTMRQCCRTYLHAECTWEQKYVDIQVRSSPAVCGPDPWRPKTQGN